MSTRRTHQFIKQTKVGKVVKVVKEHYTRDDIPCGYINCQLCAGNVTTQHLQSSDHTYRRLGNSKDTSDIDPTLQQYNNILNHDSITQHKQTINTELPTLIVLDTNVVLHQIDLLEQQYNNHCIIFNNLIIAQTVLDEVKHRSTQVYNRIRALVSHSQSTHYVYSNEYSVHTYIKQNIDESINDRNDRAIRQVVKYYATHLNNICNIIMLTNDKLNQQSAHADNIRCYTVRQYIHLFNTQYPTLIDQLARTESEIIESDQRNQLNGDSATTDTSGKRSWSYTEYLSQSQIESGLLNRTLDKGTLKVSNHYYGEATITIVKRDGVTRQIVYIPTLQHVNRAVDGDIVVVQILPKNEWVTPSKQIDHEMMDDIDINEIEMKQDDTYTAPSSNAPKSTVCTGRVVGIIERRWRPYGGSIELSDKSRGTVLFLPANKRIPKIRIDSKQITELLDKRILVQIDSWPITSYYPVGHYIKSIGLIGDHEAETQLLLIEHDINTTEWSNSVLQCLPCDENNIDQSHTVGRVDLRATHNIVSIDPPGCTDIDDALHCHQLPNGNYDIGVHIADVTHYIKPDTPIDNEAESRGTSVYLVDRRIDMLPRQLSSNLCSLKSNVDRLTFSVSWEMTPQGNIISTKFYKAVICSKRSFTYQQAQQCIDDIHDHSDIAQSLRQLSSIAKILKQKRIAAGALQLASSEIKFLIDKQSSQPLDVELYQLRDTNSLVEEFMLLGNIAAAKRILQFYPVFALLRRHPTPTNDMLQPLVQSAALAGFTIDTSTSKSLADSLDRCVVDGFPYFNKLIRILCTRCMTQAVYFISGDVNPNEYHHYGLASPVYTHFTSPIRRYADIVVHRILSSTLNNDMLPNIFEDRARVRITVDTINYRHRMAQLVSRASTELYTQIFFYKKQICEDATIIAVRANGIRIIVPRYGLEGNIKLNEIMAATDHNNNTSSSPTTTDTASSSLQYSDDTMTLTDTSKHMRLTIFEQVRVVIETKESKNRRRWLSITLHPDCKESIPIHVLVQRRSQINNNNETDQIDSDINRFADELTEQFVLHDTVDTANEIEMKHAADSQSAQYQSTDNDSYIKRARV